jgi:uncharacterized membrane protein
MRVARHAFVAAATAWAAALPLAAYGAAAPAARAPWYPLVFAVYALGSAICHQQPERSLEMWGSQLPVCARCLGVYTGGAVAGLLGFTAAGRLTPRRYRSVLLIALIPTSVTLVYEWLTGVMPANWLRAVTGATLGAAVAAVVVSALASHDGERT